MTKKKKNVLGHFHAWHDQITNLSIAGFNKNET